MSEKISFGIWLREQRRLLDLSCQAFADRVGIAEITLRRIEAGTLKPSKELALILLEKTDIPPKERESWVQFARGLSGIPAASEPPSNLPASLTSFIGREREQAAVISLINKHRLITLTGSGGVGKTRLAVKTVGQLLKDFPDGVWLAEFAPLDSAEFLSQAIASALGITPPADSSPAQTLVNYLRGKTTLLIFDNCEHILDDCARLADFLLKNCPNLKILATSREALGILGEAAYRVPSFGLPDARSMFDPLRETDSARLFEERAQLVQTDFTLTMENASSVAQICLRLDGIPLAIELAAIHTNQFFPAELAEQLDQCFHILTGGSRAALPRQQTLRASIDWSWNLLSDAERVLLRRLSIFAGGWTLDSAQAVCSDGSLDSEAVLALMPQLMKKSLVMAEHAPECETRHRFHEVVRQYANEKLVEAGEIGRIRERHMDWFAAFSKEAEYGLVGSQQFEWHRRVVGERDNLRAAMGYALKTGNALTGLLISGSLGKRFWENFDVREGAHWLGEFLQRVESHAHPAARAKALHVQGGLFYILQQFDLARAAEEESAALFRAAGDKQGEIDALLVLGSAMQYLESMDRKVEILQNALRLAESVGDDWRQARALVGLAWDTRDLQRSYAYSEKAIELFRRAGDWRMLAFVLGVLGHLLVMNGEVTPAKKRLEEALELNRRMNFKSEMEFVLTASAYIALLDEDYEQAREYLLEWIAVAEELGNRMEYLWARARLGYVSLREGVFLPARDILTECAREFHKDGNQTGLIFTLETAAALLVEFDQLNRAAQLLGWAEAARRATGDSRPKVEQAGLNRISSLIRLKLGAGAFKSMFDKGCAMTLDEAVEFALKGMKEGL